MVSELLRRLKVNKAWSLELVLCSFLINILALSSSLYSIQVLNRYMALGIDSTLLTLTLGVLITVSFEILLRGARLKLTQVICKKSDDSLMKLVFTGLGLSEYKTIARHSLGQRKEMLAGFQNVIQAFNAVNLNNLMDAPFCLVFLTALYWISPKLTAYMVLLILTISALSLIYHARMRITSETQTQQSVKHSQLMQFLISHLETIRTFNAQNYVLNRWNEDFDTSYQARVRLQNEQNAIQQASYAGTILTTVIIYGLGSKEVMLGNLNVGTLIGASILASRALSNVTRLLQLSDTLVKARQGLVMLAALSKIPLERQKGYVPAEINGQLELVDLCFQYPESRNPVFEALNVRISAGSITAVKGTNGSGKTTLARILTGLMNPIRGQILLDGVELFQIVPEWWRKQIMYLPQEPGFIDASILENLMINAPFAQREQILDLCSKVGLGNFLNNLESGLDEPVLAGGLNLPVGIRRRLALVRALAAEGKIVILDEPTEGIDPDGCRAVSMVLNELIKNGHTLILMTNDPYILEVAHTTIDLDSKPVPSITTKTQIKPS